MAQEPGRFVDAGGQPVALPEGAWSEVELQGRRIAAIAHDASLGDEPQLARTVGAAAALALENQRLSAELRANIEELRASRLASSTPATPSGGGSSAICTTARSPASWHSRSCFGGPA